MKLERTERGFLVSHFTDLYGSDCSIQESSIASTHAIWIGVHKDRMHLDRKMVHDLLPHLIYFANTGELTETLPPIRTEIATEIKPVPNI